MSETRTPTLERRVAPIDPRIRARRIHVRRVEGRRRLQRVVDAGLVVVVALGFLGALWTPLLDVDEVRVQGAGHTGVDAVLERAGIQAGDQLVRVDLAGAGTRVAALPWVQQVRLERSLDGRVTLDVRERTPVALLGSGAQALLVDRDGRVLGPASAAPELGGLTQLQGVPEAVAPGAYLPEQVDDALALAEALSTAAPGAVSSLELDGLTAVLVQGGLVRFGDARQLDAKVRSLRTVLDQVDLTCLGVIDLRLPGSPVLTREEGCS